MWLLMRDYLTFQVRGTDNKKYLFECKDSKSESGKSLLVTVEATHAGLINGNHRFYRPDRMLQSAHTFLDSGARYPKPVLSHHNSDGDALGRIVTSKYVDTTHLYADDFPQVRNLSFFDSAAKPKKLSLFDSVEYIADKLHKIPDYRGLGYIKLGLNLTNPDAIQKALREEYLSVSVGFATDAAVCSVCHTDWAVDDRCDHKMGEMVDGKRMFLITGNFNYKECSFVNFPADPFAKILSKDLQAVAGQDRELVKVFCLGLPADMIGEVSKAAGAGTLNLSDAIEEDIRVADESTETAMDFEAIRTEIADAALSKERAAELRAQLEGFTSTDATEKGLRRRLLLNLSTLFRKNNWNDSDAVLTKDQVEAKIAGCAETIKSLSEEARANYLDRLSAEAAAFGLSFDAADFADASEDAVENWDGLPAEDAEYFTNPDQIYEDLCREMEDAVCHGELENREAIDAKLSAGARKKLKSSTFCGPNRSFPVPDCAHVTAARRLVGRAKLSDSTKSKILACVSRKAQALGCGAGEKKDAEMTFSQIVLDAMLKAGYQKDEIEEKFLATKKVVQSIEDHYKGIEKDEEKSAFRRCLGAMLSMWDAESWYSYLKHELFEKEPVADALIPKAELQALEDGLEEANQRIEKLEQSNAVLVDANKALIDEQKKTLSKVLVTYRVLAREAGYQNLSADAVQESIARLSQRQLVSLRDSLEDTLDRLPSFAVPVEEKPKEDLTQQVADSASVADPDSPETEDKPAATDSAEQISPKIVRWLPPTARSRTVSSARYQLLKKKLSEKE